MADRLVIDPGEDPYLYGQSIPMMPPGQPPITEMDYRKVDPPPLFRVRPPEGAPNVVIVLMDQSCYARSGDVRRADPHADAGTAGGERGDVPELQGQRGVRPDADGVVDWPQQSPEQHGDRDRDEHGVSW